MQHQKSKSEFAKFKKELFKKKSFLPVTYISSHHFQKRKEKKCTADCSLHLWKKSKTYLLEKKIFPSLFFLSFFSVKSPYYKNKNIFWCRVETKIVVNLNKFPHLFYPILLLSLFLEICFDWLLFLSYPPFLFLRKKSISRFLQ